MGRIHPDLSLTEVKIILHYTDDLITELSSKSVNNPMNENDYKKLYRISEAIQKINRCRWIKEYY